MKYSAVILTRNEEHQIGHCFESIRPIVNLDEVLVVDDKSTDQTVDNARIIGAHVLTRDLENNWAAQRNYALDYAEANFSSDWLLMIDADERLDPEAVRSLDAFTPLSDTKAARLKRRNYYKERWLKHGRFYPDQQTRVLRSDVRYKTARPVHEMPDVDESGILLLEGHLEHFTFASMGELFGKMRRYARIEAVAGQGLERPLPVRITRHLGRLPVQKAFLDGMPGFLGVAAEVYGDIVRSTGNKGSANSYEEDGVINGLAVTKSF